MTTVWPVSGEKSGANHERTDKYGGLFVSCKIFVLF